MATRNHPASVSDLDEALGTPGSQLASKRVAVIEDRILSAALDAAREASTSGRGDRVRTAFVEPLKHFARIVRNRPEAELDRWLAAFIADRRHQEEVHR